MSLSASVWNEKIPPKHGKHRDKLKKNSIGYRFRRQWRLFLFLTPGFLCFFLFSYLPMFGIVVAFQDYSPFTGFLKSPFVGFKWFTQVFTSPDFLKVISFTLRMSVSKLVIEFLPPIILALLLNELIFVKYKRVVQTVFYLPHFLSWVVAAVIVYRVLDADDGVLNNLLIFLHIAPSNYLADAKYFIPITVISDIWKEVGWGTIYFLAALTSIDMSLYEAAAVDGAGRLRQTWHITLTGIMPTAIMLLILNVGGIVNANFDQVFNLQNPIIMSDTEVINTYIYRRAMMDGAYSFSTAFGIAQGAVSFLLIYVTNRISRRFTSISIY